MEKQDKSFCSLLPHACSLGLSEPRSVNQPVFAPVEKSPVATDKDIRKPWSVFEGVYWI